VKNINDKKKPPEIPGAFGVKIGTVFRLFPNRWIVGIKMTIQAAWELVMDPFIMGQAMTLGAFRNLSVALMAISTGNT